MGLPGVGAQERWEEEAPRQVRSESEDVKEPLPPPLPPEGELKEEEGEEEAVEALALGPKQLAAHRLLRVLGGIRVAQGARQAVATYDGASMH